MQAEDTRGSLSSSERASSAVAETQHSSCWPEEIIIGILKFGFKSKGVIKSEESLCCISSLSMLSQIYITNSTFPPMIWDWHDLYPLHCVETSTYVLIKIRIASMAELVEWQCSIFLELLESKFRAWSSVRVSPKTRSSNLYFMQDIDSISGSISCNEQWWTQCSWLLFESQHTVHLSYKSSMLYLSSCCRKEYVARHSTCSDNVYWQKWMVVWSTKHICYEYDCMSFSMRTGSSGGGRSFSCNRLCSRVNSLGTFCLSAGSRSWYAFSRVMSGSSQRCSKYPAIYMMVIQHESAMLCKRVAKRLKCVLDHCRSSPFCRCQQWGQTKIIEFFQWWFWSTFWPCK